MCSSDLATGFSRGYLVSAGALALILVIAVFMMRVSPADLAGADPAPEVTPAHPGQPGPDVAERGQPGGEVLDRRWTVTSYTLTLASLILLVGSLSDRWGRRVFLAGLGSFTAVSVLCAAAPGIGWLIATRAVPGAGGLRRWRAETATTVPTRGWQ